MLPYLCYRNFTLHSDCLGIVTIPEIYKYVSSDKVFITVSGNFCFSFVSSLVKCYRSRNLGLNWDLFSSIFPMGTQSLIWELDGSTVLN